MKPQIAIIIPTFNEAKNIAALIKYLKKNDPNNLSEIIVSDGQSIDDTFKIANTAGAKVFVSPIKGRASQMNFGALFAQAGILYFVHADTFPPESFLNDILQATSSGYGFGRYQTKFNSSKGMLKLNAWFTRFDWFICYGGDQTLFITKKLFDQIGGFRNSMLIMEDYDIVTRAKRFAKYKILSKAALISARKYNKNSWLKVLLANRAIVKMYKCGATQTEMTKKYNDLLNYS